MATILLVDDSKTLALHIGGMLKQGGHDVITALTGTEAVEHLRSSTKIDLVLTDLYMPEPDGFDVVAAVRALAEPPPLIVMSSHTLVCGVFRDASELGAAAVLQKPFTSDKLLETVAECLGAGCARA